MDMCRKMTQSMIEEATKKHEKTITDMLVVKEKKDDERWSTMMSLMQSILPARHSINASTPITNGNSQRTLRPSSPLIENEKRKKSQHQQHSPQKK